MFDRTHNVRTKALNDLFIRRHLDILRKVENQDRLQVTVRLIPSHVNKADMLTRVLNRWLPLQRSQSSEEVCVAAVYGTDASLHCLN